MIEAKIICDSINPAGNRITTWILKYPRFIHAEFMTHRILSKNAASSRAITLEKMIQAVLDEPAIPEFWGKNQKGMQAAEELNLADQETAKLEWLAARDKAVESVRNLQKLNLHKQLSNRLLEPWAHITVLSTGTDWENFFALRAHPEAQPEFQKLAYLMLERYNSSEPEDLEMGQWHIPFGDKYLENVSIQEALKICTARAARVSYNNFEGDIDFKKDFELHDKLLASGHMSPFEHCAKAQNNSARIGNFTGWLQYRKTFKGENKTDPRVIKSDRFSKSKNIMGKI
jgi:thymidylate synthase ThyX